MYKCNDLKGRCTDCRTTKSVWCCLECYHIGCGRYEKKHALIHAQKDKHWICVNMESPQHLWCYKCDQAIYFDGDDSDEDSANNSNSSSNSNSPTNNRRNQRTPINSNRSSMRSNIILPPSVKYKQ